MSRSSSAPESPVAGTSSRERRAASVVSPERAAALARTAAAAADLLDEGDRAHAGIPTDARDLLLTEIAPDPDQPRRRFDDGDLRALADDIARRGVLQPVLVRPPARPGEPYRLVAGERRWRASRIAGRNRIPARIRDLSDDDVQAAQLAENVLRTDLSDIEKGRALRRLYEFRKAQNRAATWEDIAAEVGLGRARIHDLFHLASLPEPVAHLIDSGRLSGSHGIVLQRAHDRMSPDDMAALAARAARPEGLPGGRRGKTAGGFGLSVARLRAEVQSVLDAPPPSSGNGAASAGVEGTPPNPRIRPWVRRFIDKAASGTLRPEEREALRGLVG